MNDAHLHSLRAFIAMLAITAAMAPASAAPSRAPTARTLPASMLPARTLSVPFDLSPARTPHTRLLVADRYAGNGGRVFEFALTNGRVSPRPIAAITSVSAPTGIAVGPDGDIYVGDGNGIEVFAPTAVGNAKPLRTLDTAGSFAVGVAVDAANNLYVGAGPGVLVFPPGAFGITQPIAQIYLPGGTARVMAFDSAGDLYVSYGSNVYVFATPATHPTFLRQFCLHPNTGVYGMVIGTGGFLFALSEKSISIFSQTLNQCPPPPHGIITPKGAPVMWKGSGLAFQGHHLFTVVPGSIYGPPAVYEFDAHAGTQTPLSYVAWSKFSNPAGVALGF